MSFAHPWLLWLLVLPLLVAVVERRWLQHRVAMPSARGGAGTSRGWLPAMVKTATLGPACLAACVVILLAAPQVERIAPAERQQRNVHFLIDISGSMSGPLPSGRSKFNAAFDAMQQFVQFRKGDAFGMSVFGAYMIEWLPLTKDLPQLGHARDFLQPGSLPLALTGGTAAGTSIQQLCPSLEASGTGERLIILISDGLAGDVNERTEAGIVTALQRAKTSLYVVIIGDSARSPVLDRVCLASGGECFTGVDEASMSQVFTAIDRLSTTEMRPLMRGRADWFGPVAWSIATLGGAYVLSLWFLRYTPW